MTLNHPKPDVVVVGAGPVGLMTALAIDTLANGEIRLLVLDRAARLTAGAASGSETPAGVQASVRAVALTAASIRLLTRCGVWDRLEASAFPVAGIDVTDGDLGDCVRTPILRFDFEPTRTGEPSMAMVRDRDLQNAIAAAVALRPSIEQCHGVDVTAFTIEHGRPVLTLADGATIHAQVAVAADGRNSRLRTLAGIGTVEAETTQTGIVTLVRFEKPHGYRAIQHFLPGGPFAILPLEDFVACITWGEDQHEASRLLALDDDAFAAALRLRVGPAFGHIALMGQRASWPLARHQARRMIASGVALAGDAARSVHPIAGQGMNLGLMDAAVLADVLVDAARLGLEIGQIPILERYERWRRANSTRALASFDFLNTVFSQGSTVARSIRSAGVGMIDRSQAIKDALMLEAQGLGGELPTLMAEPVRAIDGNLERDMSDRRLPPFAARL